MLVFVQMAVFEQSGHVLTKKVVFDKMAVFEQKWLCEDKNGGV